MHTDSFQEAVGNSALTRTRNASSSGGSVEPTMRYALLVDLKEVYKHFAVRRDVFPHIRFDRIKRMIEAGEVIYEDGVIITYSQYKKRQRLGSVTIPASSIMLHQILNTSPGNHAASAVFETFVKEVVRTNDLYLAVREDNAAARRFYEKQKLTVAGYISWKGGALPGVIYKLNNSSLF